MPHPYQHIVEADGSESLTVLIDPPVTVRDDHPHFDAIWSAAVDDDSTDEEIRELADLSLAVASAVRPLSERVTVADGSVYFDGDRIDNSLTQHIVRLLDAGDVRGWGALVNFMEKLAQNPSERSREQLYDWLRDRPFSITEWGDLVAYKGVRADSNGNYVSLHAGPAIINGVPHQGGPVPNAVGDVIELGRSQVDDNSFVGCSTGLHAGTYGYAEGYSSSGVMLRVTINPRDVVSVPTDCDAQKIRVCRYFVDDIVEAADADPVVFGDEPAAEAVEAVNGLLRQVAAAEPDDLSDERYW